MAKSGFFLDGRELLECEIPSMTRDEALISFLETISRNEKLTECKLSDILFYAKTLRDSKETVRDSALKRKTGVQAS